MDPKDFTSENTPKIDRIDFVGCNTISIKTN
jgi:hypothetical protein